MAKLCSKCTCKNMCYMESVIVYDLAVDVYICLSIYLYYLSIYLSLSLSLSNIKISTFSTVIQYVYTVKLSNELTYILVMLASVY